MVRSRKGPTMNDYMITTDNNADLPEDFYKNHEVGCTYLSYTLEGKEYREAVMCQNVESENLTKGVR